ncbi:unnamed protein product, partial [marine sediment metagenome]
FWKTFGGQVEVMVWPKVYADTTDLWQEGNILEVSGKVRLRDDRVQLSCEEVRRYQPPVQEEEVIMAPPVQEEEVIMAPPVQEEEIIAAPLVEAPAVEAAPPTPTSRESRRLVIRLSQTSDEEADRDKLHKVKDILRSFPGNDEVRLQLTINGKIKNMRFFDIYTNYCPELRQRLVALVGEEGVRLESH